MSSEPSRPVPGPPRVQAWFPDTNVLINLAIHRPLRRIVHDVVSRHRIVLVSAVVAELRGLSRAGRPLGGWADTALCDLDWLGPEHDLDDPEGTDLAVTIQEELSAGQELSHPYQHFGEAAIVALAMRARIVKPVVLSDDRTARVIARRNGLTSLSLPKLLSGLVRRSRLTASEAEDLARPLAEAGRWPLFTADDFSLGTLAGFGLP